MDFVLGLLLGVAITAGLIWGLRAWRRRGIKSVSYLKAAALLDEEEKRFVATARRALSPEFEIFAKVNLADVVRPSPAAFAALRHGALARLRLEHADFVVCTPDNGQIVGVIEFDGGE